MQDLYHKGSLHHIITSVLVIVSSTGQKYTIISNSAVLNA